jgi:S-adenosylmethionine decarboxylase proenzyme
LDFLGTQWTAELYGCDAAMLDDVDDIRALMLAAADVAHATIVGSQFHRFSPYGVSGVVVIAESHLAIHTWPEHGYAALDVFSCGLTLHADAAFRFLADKLGATHVDSVCRRRGAPDRIAALSATENA